jgi:hypothetical protein
MQKQTSISFIICMLKCLFMNTALITEIELFEVSVNEGC